MKKKFWIILAIIVTTVTLVTTVMPANVIAGGCRPIPRCLGDGNTGG